MKFKINFEMLRKAKEKGFCLCEIKKLSDNSNVCPCEEFLNNQKCKCGVFN